ncbi:MAG: hypothetical protein OSA05_10370 [Nitrospinaceae bacterium]|nr:hypothetical protein [Nitrospinaceae bacterium]
MRNFLPQGNQLVFKEMFQEETFTPANITHMEKKSLREIINFSKPNSFKNVGVFFIHLEGKDLPLQEPSGP